MAEDVLYEEGKIKVVYPDPNSIPSEGYWLKIGKSRFYFARGALENYSRMSEQELRSIFRYDMPEIFHVMDQEGPVLRSVQSALIGALQEEERRIAKFKESNNL